jgi:hypothetical protein
MTERTLRRLPQDALVGGYLAVALDDLALQISIASPPRTLHPGSLHAGSPDGGFDPALLELLGRVDRERRELILRQRRALEGALEAAIPPSHLSKALKSVHGVAPAPARVGAHLFQAVAALVPRVPSLNETPGNGVVLPRFNEEGITREAGALHGVLVTGRVPPPLSVPLASEASDGNSPHLLRLLARALLVCALDPDRFDLERISWIHVGPRVRGLATVGLQFIEPRHTSKGEILWDVSA